MGWTMTPAEWEELRLALWDAMSESFPLPYLRRLAAEGKLGDPPLARRPPRPAVNGPGDIVPVPRQHLSWLFLLAARATAGDPL